MIRHPFLLALFARSSSPISAWPHCGSGHVWISALAMCACGVRTVEAQTL